MAGKFSFINYVETIKGFKKNGIHNVLDQTKLLSKKILESSEKSISVLDIIGLDHNPENLLLIEQALLLSISRYYEKHESNMPIILINIDTTGIRHFKKSQKFSRNLRRNNTFIPAVDDYGDLFSILGADEKVGAVITSLLEFNRDKKIQTKEFSNLFKNDAIKKNGWMWRKSRGFYQAKFSMSELINKMMKNIIDYKLMAAKDSHLLLLSGKHVKRYISNTDIFNSSLYNCLMARLIFRKCRAKEIDFIVSYSDQTDSLCKAIIGEFEKDGQTIVYKETEKPINPYRKSTLRPLKELNNKKILIVTNVISTGELLGEIAQSLKREGAIIQGMVSVAQTNEYKGNYKNLFFSLCYYKIELFEPSHCPACQSIEKKVLYYLNPWTNSLSPLLLRDNDLSDMSNGAEDNRLLWDMIEETNALNHHISLGKGRRHYYYYIDTQAILDKKRDQIEWDIDTFLKDKEKPDTVLTTENPGARGFANLIKEKYMSYANVVVATKESGQYTISKRSSLQNKKVLIALDTASTGNSLIGLMNLIKKINNDLNNVTICLFINRLTDISRETLINYINEENIYSIYTITIPAFTDDPNSCPLCTEIDQLNKHYASLSLGSKRYLDDRLSEIKLIELDDAHMLRPSFRPKLMKSILNKGKIMDYLNSKGESAILEMLIHNVSLENTYLILDVIPPEYLRIIEVKNYLSNQIKMSGDIEILSKAIQVALNVNPDSIMNGIKLIIDKFVKNERSKFLTYALEYLIAENKSFKIKINKSLMHIKKKYPKNLDFINSIYFSINFKIPQPIFLRPSLIEVYENTILKVVQKDITVLITGETGVGKDVIAELIHKSSRRHNKPFVKLIINTFQSQLLESELFGHVKGAYTGAAKDRKGGFMEADGGTVFLNEIGDVPIELQDKLLDVIENKRFKRVGENEEKKSDFRLICATNKNLFELIQNGRFREDLYYRINVINIKIPELKGHLKDIEKLSESFFDDSSRNHNVPVIKNKKEAIKEFKDYAWPGNVRQLKNFIESATVLANDGIIDMDFLREYIKEKSNSVTINKDETLDSLLNKVASDYVVEVLEIYNGNKTKSAKHLGITRPKLYKIMYRNNIPRQKGNHVSK